MLSSVVSRVLFSNSQNLQRLSKALIRSYPSTSASTYSHVVKRNTIAKPCHLSQIHQSFGFSSTNNRRSYCTSKPEKAAGSNKGADEEDDDDFLKLFKKPPGGAASNQFEPIESKDPTSLANLHLLYENFEKSRVSQSDTTESGGKKKRLTERQKLTNELHGASVLLEEHIMKDTKRVVTFDREMARTFPDDEEALPQEPLKVPTIRTNSTLPESYYLPQARNPQMKRFTDPTAPTSLRGKVKPIIGEPLPADHRSTLGDITASPGFRTIDELANDLKHITQGKGVPPGHRTLPESLESESIESELSKLLSLQPSSSKANASQTAAHNDQKPANIRKGQSDKGSVSSIAQDMLAQRKHTPKTQEFEEDLELEDDDGEMEDLGHGEEGEVPPWDRLRDARGKHAPFTMIEVTEQEENDQDSNIAEWVKSLGEEGEWTAEDEAALAKRKPVPDYIRNAHVAPKNLSDVKSLKDLWAYQTEAQLRDGTLDSNSAEYHERMSRMAPIGELDSEQADQLEKRLIKRHQDAVRDASWMLTELDTSKATGGDPLTMESHPFLYNEAYALGLMPAELEWLQKRPNWRRRVEGAIVRVGLERKQLQEEDDMVNELFIRVVNLLSGQHHDESGTTSPQFDNLHLIDISAKAGLPDSFTNLMQSHDLIEESDLKARHDAVAARDRLAKKLYEISRNDPQQWASVLHKYLPKASAELTKHVYNKDFWSPNNPWLMNAFTKSLIDEAMVAEKTVLHLPLEDEIAARLDEIDDAEDPPQYGPLGENFGDNEAEAATGAGEREAMYKVGCLFCSKHRHRFPLDPVNVPLLTRFMNIYGKILPRKQTGLCVKHQKRVSQTIKVARNMNLFTYKKSFYSINNPFKSKMENVAFSSGDSRYGSPFKLIAEQSSPQTAAKDPEADEDYHEMDEEDHNAREIESILARSERIYRNQALTDEGPTLDERVNEVLSKVSSTRFEDYGMKDISLEDPDIIPSEPPSHYQLTEQDLLEGFEEGPPPLEVTDDDPLDALPGLPYRQSRIKMTPSDPSYDVSSDKQSRDDILAQIAKAKERRNSKL